jgi:hypothetical protein
MSPSSFAVGRQEFALDLPIHSHRLGKLFGTQTATVELSVYDSPESK